MLNLWSLVLGLIAWLLPIVNLMRYKSHDHRNWAAFSIMRISACAISLWLQILATYHKVRIEDWSALLDTIGTIAFVATVLLIGSIILNAINMIVYRKKG